MVPSGGGSRDWRNYHLNSDYYEYYKMVNNEILFSVKVTFSQFPSSLNRKGEGERSALGSIDGHASAKC